MAGFATAIRAAFIVLTGCFRSRPPGHSVAPFWIRVILDERRVVAQGGAPMLARVSQVTMFVMVTWCLVLVGTRSATAQALCPAADAQPFRETGIPGFDAGFPRGPEIVTVEADLGAFGDTVLGGTWRMPNAGGFANDGLALEGVSFTQDMEPGSGSILHTYDVVVDLRALGNIVTDLEFVVVDGERRLRLGAFTDIDIRCEATSVSRTFSISDHDFVSFFSGGGAPTLRVERTSRAGGC